MLRAISLGKNALGQAAPNPMVGCVIVYNDKIIGEGYTSPFGGSHAEVNAINSVNKKDTLPQATLYVTLEPCSHYGKTPPCANLIIKHGIKKVVVGLQDPNPKVAGKGIALLENAGITVIVGVLEKACREHHKRFLCMQVQKRPYIILKWAQTANGFIAPENKKRTPNAQPFWISNLVSQQLVHQWRTQEMAILVGTNTVLKDNPKLNVRTWKGNNPIRLVIDRNLKIPQQYNVHNAKQTTYFFVSTINGLPKEKGVTINFNQPIVPQIVAALYQLDIASIIIEGGLQTLQSFIDHNLWDEARVFKSNTTLPGGIKAPVLDGNLSKTVTVMQDTLTHWIND